MSAEIFALPRMGETMESGRVVAWVKQPGQGFARGETIVEIETDKTTVEIPALADGKLLEIIAVEGTDVEVGAPLCRFASDSAQTVAALDDDGVEPPVDVTDAPLVIDKEADKPRDEILQILPLPRMGETMESGRIGAWIKKPGERFKRGETIVEIESDKTTVELPALEDGFLVEILAEEGSELDVGAPLCSYRGTATPASSQPAATDAPALIASEKPVVTSAARRAVSVTRQRATPLARKLARQNGVPLAEVAGSGRRGRIEAADIRALNSGIGVTPGRTPPQRFVDLPSGRLALREWHPTSDVRGAVVLLHGFAGDAQTWSGLGSMLAATGLCVAAPDLPAHGATTIDATSPTAMVAPIVALAEKEDWNDIELVGHSMGAIVAVNAAAQLGRRVRRLTLLSPAGMGSEIDETFLGGMAHATTAGALAHLLRRIAVRPPALSEAQLSDMVALLGPKQRLVELAASLARAGIQQYDIVRSLADLTVPTRIVWGLDDRIVPWSQIRNAPARVAIHLLSDAGHMPHWDRPKETASLFA